MTLEASHPVIYLRCGSGSDALLAIDCDDGRIEVFAESDSPVGRFLAERFADEPNQPAETLVVQRAELLALAHMILHMLDNSQ